MEQDYKEQLRMMTEGLGEWMDHREREQRRRRRWTHIALGVLAVAAAVVLQIFFPWRRETVKYIYVNDTAQTTVITHDTVFSQSTNPTTTKKSNSIRIGGGEEGGWGFIDINEKGVRISGGDDGENVNIEIDAGGVHINGKGISK